MKLVVAVPSSQQRPFFAHSTHISSNLAFLFLADKFKLATYIRGYYNTASNLHRAIGYTCEFVTRESEHGLITSCTVFQQGLSFVPPLALHMNAPAAISCAAFSAIHGIFGEPSRQSRALSENWRKGVGSAFRLHLSSTSRCFAHLPPVNLPLIALPPSHEHLFWQ